MSGGRFLYRQSHLLDIVDEIRLAISNEASTERNNYDEPLCKGYSAETLDKFKMGVDILNLAYIYAQRIDWLLSCDDNEEDFHQRLKEDIKNCTAWWLS